MHIRRETRECEGQHRTRSSNPKTTQYIEVPSQQSKPRVPRRKSKPQRDQRSSRASKRNQGNRCNIMEGTKEARPPAKGATIPIQINAQCIHDRKQMEQHTKVQYR
jgi:hypothetical protein